MNIGINELIVVNWNITFKKFHRATLSATLVYEPEKNVDFEGGVIEVADNTNFFYLFKGTIRNRTIYDPFEVNGVLYIDIEAEDFSALVTRRIIAKVITSSTLVNVVTNHIMPILNAEGITLGKIEGDFTIDKDIWAYMNIDDVLNRILSYRSGYYWYISFDRELFIKRHATSTEVNFSILNNFTDLRIEENLDVYRNTQYLLSEDVNTAVLEEIIKADGKTQNFLTRFKLAEKPIEIWTTDDVTGEITEEVYWYPVIDIELNDSGLQADFYWTKGSNQIVQREDWTLPETGAIKIKYIGTRKSAFKLTNNNEINKRKALEPNTSGIYEAVEQVKNMVTSRQLLDYGTTLLNKYGLYTRKLEFKTYEHQFKVGNKLSVSLPFYGQVASKYIIDNISATQVDPELVEYSITAYDSESYGEWEKVFYDMYKEKYGFNYGVDDMLLTEVMAVDERIKTTENYIGSIHRGILVPFEVPFTFNDYVVWII
jgi:hypothetical protein